MVSFLWTTALRRQAINNSITWCTWCTWWSWLWRLKRCLIRVFPKDCYRCSNRLQQVVLLIVLLLATVHPTDSPSWSYLLTVPTSCPTDSPDPTGLTGPTGPSYCYCSCSCSRSNRLYWSYCYWWSSKAGDCMLPFLFITSLLMRWVSQWGEGANRLHQAAIDSLFIWWGILLGQRERKEVSGCWSLFIYVITL